MYPTQMQAGRLFVLPAQCAQDVKAPTMRDKAKSMDAGCKFHLLITDFLIAGLLDSRMSG